MQKLSFYTEVRQSTTGSSVAEYFIPLFQVAKKFIFACKLKVCLYRALPYNV